MIDLIEGNLLDFPNDINVIAHSCNTRNIMGAGIAKQIKDRYPEAYEADWRAFNSNYGVTLGKFSKADIGDRKYIYNMYTQSTYCPSHLLLGELWHQLMKLYSFLGWLFSNPNAHAYLDFWSSE